MVWNTSQCADYSRKVCNDDREPPQNETPESAPQKPPAAPRTGLSRILSDSDNILIAALIFLLYKDGGNKSLMLALALALLM